MASSKVVKEGYLTKRGGFALWRGVCVRRLAFPPRPVPCLCSSLPLCARADAGPDADADADADAVQRCVVPRRGSLVVCGGRAGVPCLRVRAFAGARVPACARTGGASECDEAHRVNERRLRGKAQRRAPGTATRHMHTHHLLTRTTPPRNPKLTALVSGRNWKKRYFMLRADGTLTYHEKQGDEPKNTIKLGVKSQAAVLAELASEGGLFVEGPTHDPVYIKADSVQDAGSWIKKINGVIAKLSEAEALRRKNDLGAFSSVRGGALLGGRKSHTRKGRGGVKKKSEAQMVPLPSDGMYKIGPDKDAKDCFVHWKTKEYFADEKTFKDGGKALGRVDISLVV